MRIFLGRFALLALTMLGLRCHSTSSRADTLYVWSEDGTIKQISTNGVVSLLTNGFSGWFGPVGLALDSWGNLYSGSPGDSRIWKFPPNDPPVLVGPYVDSVSGLAFDGTDNLYLTSPNYRTVAIPSYFPGYGYNLNSYSTQSQEHLSYPISLAFDKAGNIFVANSASPFFSSGPYTNTIEMFSPNCVHLGTFATNLNKPWGLAFDSSGNLFVSNSGTNGSRRNTIEKFTPSGERSPFAFSIDGLSSPRGLAFDSAGYLYVANAGNGTIQKFSTYGFGAGSILVSNLTAPTSIAIQPGVKFWKATPVRITHPARLPDGAFQLSFTNTPTVRFSVVATTNLALPPSNWTTLGSAAEVSIGQFQFTDLAATNQSQRFYQVRSP